MKKLLFLIFICTTNIGFAQTSFSIKGLVFETGTSNRLAQVYVTNKNSKNEIYYIVQIIDITKRKKIELCESLSLLCVTR